MDCLKGFIGLVNGSGEKPDSGLFLSDLPGITSESISGIKDKTDQKENYDLIQDIESRALPKFRTFFTREINQCFKIYRREIIECLICDNRELIAVSLWYLMGAELMTEKLNSYRINRYTTIDKEKYQELRDDFMDTFFRELSTAVSGIDILTSPCNSEEKPEYNTVVTVQYTRP